MNGRTILLAAAGLLLAGAAAAADGPQPPCGSGVQPSFAAPGQPPATQSWSEAELKAAHWQPAPCLGWTGGRTRLAVALAAEFTHRGPIEDLLERLGAFSAYPRIRYWSASRHSWQPLATAAGLTGGGGDLHAGGITRGAAYDYFEEDRGGRVQQHLTVLERSDRRVVVEIQNTSAIALGPLPLFEPGALQSTVFLERTGADRWAWYQAVRAADGASLLATQGAASTVNRMTALYRHVADLPSGAIAEQR
jgi:hypothetical protein